MPEHHIGTSQWARGEKNRSELVLRRGKVRGKAGQMVAGVEAGREEPSGRADDNQAEEGQENSVKSGRN